MDKYPIVLPNEKEGTYRVVTIIVALINAVVFGYVYFNSTEEKLKSLALTGLLIGITDLVLFFVMNKTKFKSVFRIEIAFIICAVLWACMQLYLVAILMMVFAILGFYTNKKLLILFSKEGIRYPSFPPKLYYWEAVEQVILKDRILTIDLKSNELFQFNISPEEYKKINEDAFNAFCKSQVQAKGI